ncbi:unnamed protein product [Rotaria magnacalcarata]|uniref:HAT C-terminal dimerisation domain-containing protein n=1 Tax=Rotaria magnacalcarata TaxID=392030 RepID=A0A815XME6_9BILA|nr:unnamed protein product [Rotaria magnacalcarata]CAF1632007.1 unnamed protein product [Rotaria magnacalcarata]CAF2130158.1 unnamed protein product [Rotaria magnacalcarata]CAF3798765.1 unnamed protein product [Rotaria magnacalcarata]CAF4198444.1 unnamed protein product [Rotaria magnacalcarata]
MDTNTNSTISKDQSESIIMINDDANGPPVIKEFFSKLSTNIEKNRWTGSCNVCSLSITDTYKTTSNFLKHLKIKHRLIFDKWKSKQDQVVQETNQPKITIAYNRDNEKYSTSNKRQQLLNNSIIRNLIVNMSLPFSIVDNQSFKHFMLDVDPKYNMINRRDITRNFLPAMHKSCIKKLQEVCNRSNYISLTLDVWSDRRMRSYFGITLHAIVDDHYKTYLLSFERLTGKYSGEKLAAEFDRVTQLYNLKDKLVRIITDNANNNQAAFNHLVLPGFDEYFDDSIDDQSELETNDDDTNNDECDKNRLEIEEVNDDIYGSTLNAPTDQEFLRLPCFIHSLQLVVHDGIKAASGALSSLKKVADLAKLAHTSNSFAERLEEHHYSIPRANSTRWNSQFQTVKKVIGIPFAVLNSILTDLNKNSTILTQGECYATISLVAPTILGILIDLEHELAASNLSLVSLCEALISSIKARFSGLLCHFEIDVPFASYSMSERFSDPIFLVTPVLDARFKFLWLDNLQGMKMGADELNIVQQDTSDQPTQKFDPITKRKCLFPYLNDLKKISSDEKEKPKILVELNAFLWEKSNETNLLFLKKNIYPSLYELGLKYLSVPATSAPIERIFSQSGFVMRPHRASLTSKNVCLLTFLKCNQVLL